VVQREETEGNMKKREKVEGKSGFSVDKDPFVDRSI